MVMVFTVAALNQIWGGMSTGKKNGQKFYILPDQGVRTGAGLIFFMQVSPLQRKKTVVDLSGQ